MDTEAAHWDPSAVMASGLVFSAILVGVFAFFIIFKTEKFSEQVFRFVISLMALFIIGGLKFYGQVGTEIVTFVFGAIIGYVFSGKPTVSNTRHDD